MDGSRRLGNHRLHRPGGFFDAVGYEFHSCVGKLGGSILTLLDTSFTGFL